MEGDRTGGTGAGCTGDGTGDDIDETEHDETEHDSVMLEVAGDTPAGDFGSLFCPALPPQSR